MVSKFHAFLLRKGGKVKTGANLPFTGSIQGRFAKQLSVFWLGLTENDKI